MRHLDAKRVDDDDDDYHTYDCDDDVSDDDDDENDDENDDDDGDDGDGDDDDDDDDDIRLIDTTNHSPVARDETCTRRNRTSRDDPIETLFMSGEQVVNNFL